VSVGAAEAELAVTLVSGAVGAFLLLVTSGTAGGSLVQPRVIKGMPVGPAAQPGTPGQPGDKPGDKPGGDKPGEDKPKPKPKPKPGDVKPGTQGGGGQGGGGGGGEGGEQGTDSIPLCLWDMLDQKVLAATVTEAEPYAIARIALPWPALNTGPFDMSGLGSPLKVGQSGYYVTAVILHTLLQSGVDPNLFAQGNILKPGCLIPAGATVDGQPLRKLYDAWQSGEGG